MFPTLALILALALALTPLSICTGPALQQHLAQAYHAPLYTYPTSLTQGILPIYIHSHNDYWRPVPLYSALAVGAVSIEADVWLYNDTLHVGHEESALTPARTFESLYITPLLDVLARQNPKSVYLTERKATHNGVYDTASTQTLYLFVDVKTDGPTTWPYVVKALQPLQAGGWLSTVNSSNLFTSGAITVIGTGNTPLDQVQSAPLPRYTFFDADIAKLGSSQSNITALVSPIASTDFAANFGDVNGTSLNATQLGLLREQVKVAHGRGIMVRYWDQPGWPVGTRNGLWRQLKDEGVDLLNVDDLEGAAVF